MTIHRAQLVSPQIVCIGCGCTEHHACLVKGLPCSWVAVNEDSGNGMCSACAGKPLDELLRKDEA